MKRSSLRFVTYLIIIYTTLQLGKSDPCQDETSYCLEEKCENPGIQQRCNKTCGVCRDRDDCPGGRWDVNCTKSCSTGCEDNTCHQDTGACTRGCVRGKWGTHCSRNCSVRCIHSRCYQDTGVCASGCKSCYTGTQCLQVYDKCNCSSAEHCHCRAGYFGDGCMEQCNYNCKYKQCLDGGKCTDGCVAGWFGSTCDKACSNCNKKSCDRDDGNCTYGCDNGYHGPQCNNNCSVNCINTTCKQTDGRCVHGCDTGWFGDTCDKLCPVNCDSGSCDGSDGSCSSCKSGYTRSHCNITCPVNCAGERCNQTDGSCSECTVGWFGDTCDSNCSSGCLKHCDRQTGRCTDGCMSTVYGEFCNNTCSERCIKLQCHTTTDTKPGCTLGCEDGWFGDYCQFSCPQHCLRCHRDNGTCLVCLQGSVHNQCTAVTTSVSTELSSDDVVWILLAAVCILSVLLAVFIFRSFSKYLSSASTGPRRSDYIHPVWEDTTDFRLSRDTGDHLYSTISSRSETSETAEPWYQNL